MLRGLSVLQVALGGSLLASVLCVFVPAFAQNLHASKLAEPLSGLQDLAAAASLLAAGMPVQLAYPSSAPRTPSEVPVGVAVVDPPGTWQHATWKLLGFRPEGAHSFAFSFESAATAEGAHFVARSFGDLDGDGELSQFSVFGEMKSDGEPTVYPLRIEREIE